MTSTLDLSTLNLDHGSHSDRDAGVCLLEAVAWWAGEAHTDHPACVSPVLASFGISLNDRFPAERRQDLKRFIPLLPGTRDAGKDEARGYLALDWLIRTYTPAWLDLAGLSVEAGELRALRRIADLAAAQSAGPVVRAAQTKSAAAGDAAGDAAWAAAGAAAGDAARAAAGAAAGAAARAALQPTVDRLQASAIDLFAAMINPAAVESA